MRKNFKVSACIYPQPVAVLGTYNEDLSANAMTAAWVGVYDYEKLFIALAEHRSTDNIRRNKEFTVSVADALHVKQADYVGMVSGNEVEDKVEKCGLHPIKAEKVNAPIFEEFPIALECTLDKENEYGIIANIVNVSIDERVLDENGKVDPEKLQAISLDPLNNQYLMVKEVVGPAFEEGE